MLCPWRADGWKKAVTTIKSLQGRRVGSLESDVAGGSHGDTVTGHLSLRKCLLSGSVGSEGKPYR